MIFPSYKILDIESDSSLRLENNHLVITAEGEERQFFLEDVSLLLLSNSRITISTAILVELGKKNIPVLLFDRRHYPCAILSPLLNNALTTERAYEQMNWKGSSKDKTWKKITANKIKMQHYVMKSNEKRGTLLHLLKGLTDGDKTNIEGLAAKIYFPAVFGDGFVRKTHGDIDIDGINACLNYGYSLILALFLKAVVSMGYLPQIGIHHHNKQNPFNLACDLMEPFRPFIDDAILRHGLKELNKESKISLLNVLNSQVMLGDEKYNFKDAINHYCENAFKCLRGNIRAFQEVSFV